jgi:hypothetical protein
MAILTTGTLMTTETAIPLTHTTYVRTAFLVALRAKAMLVTNSQNGW